MERKLRFLEKEIKKDDIPMLDAGTYKMHINDTNLDQDYLQRHTVVLKASSTIIL